MSVCRDGEPVNSSYAALDVAELIDEKELMVETGGGGARNNET